MQDHSKYALQRSIYLLLTAAFFLLFTSCSDYDRTFHDIILDAKVTSPHQDENTHFNLHLSFVPKHSRTIHICEDWEKNIGIASDNLRRVTERNWNDWGCDDPIKIEITPETPFTIDIVTEFLQENNRTLVKMSRLGEYKIIGDIDILRLRFMMQPSQPNATDSLEYPLSNEIMIDVPKHRTRSDR